jgi:hypothetical protein
MRKTRVLFAGMLFALGVAGASHALAQDGAPAMASDRLEREALMAQIVAAREQTAGRVFGTELRGRLLGLLSAAPTDKLRELLATGAGGSIYGLAQTNAFGSTAADLLYTPVTPCRVLDTRASAGGILSPGAKQAFLVAGSTGFSGQGGNASGCGVPDGATAVAINFGATQSAGPGNLRSYAWAASATAPNAAVLNYGNLASVGLVTVPNGSIVPLCDPAAGTCTFDIYLETFASATHVVADVVGYFKRATSPATYMQNGTGIGALDIDAGPVVCQLSVVPTTNQTAKIDVWVVVQSTAGAFSMVLLPAYSTDGGTTFNVPNLGYGFARSGVSGTEWTQVFNSQTLDLTAGTTYIIGGQVSRQSGIADPTDYRCNTLVTLSPR